MNSESLRAELCKAYCQDIDVRAVPAGLAISGSLEDSTGDPIRCFIEAQSDGWRLVDDGQFLADLDSRGIERRSGPRAEFLARILATAGASIATDDLQIVTSVFADVPSGSEVIKFLSALTRAKDISFWNKERVKSTFKDDVFLAIAQRLGGRASLERASAVDSTLRDFPADIVIHPTSADAHFATAVFLAQSTETLAEALMLWQELRLRNKPNVRVVAVVEEGSVSGSGPKFQRVLNRIDAVTFYRGDEDAALERVERMALAVA